jgi:hypothetical protein
MTTGKLVRVKNSQRRGNEAKRYLATHLEFPNGRAQALIFSVDELKRPLRRAKKHELLP